MIPAVLACILDWIEGCLGLFELDGQVIVQDGSAWLRIAPGESARWFRTCAGAMGG